MNKLLPALAAFLAASPFLSAATDAAPTAPAATPAAEAPKPAPLSPEKKKLFLQAIGWQVGRQAQIADLGFAPDDVTEILAGARLAFEGKGEEIPPQMQKDMEAFQSFLAPYIANARAKAEKKQAEEAKLRAESAQANLTAGKAALDKLKADDKAVTFDKAKGNDGADYEYGIKITAPGSAEKPLATDTVKVKYTGKLLDGTVFDSSDAHGGQPAEFPLNGVIAGWTAGVQKLGKGGKATLWLPAGLAYGNEGAGDKIKPGATLVFDVELVDIVKPEAPKADAPAPAAAKPDAAK